MTELSVMIIQVPFQLKSDRKKKGVKFWFDGENGEI